MSWIYYALVALVWNIVVFLLFGLDKRQAKRGGRRISEKALLLMAAVMGALGALLGMLVFRHKTKHLKFKIGAPLLLLFNILCVAAFYNGLTLTSYSITSDKLAAGTSIRAVLLADLHSHVYGDNQNDLIQKIIGQKPDLILLAGDIADDKTPIEGTKLLLEGIKDIAPVFYVSGNHEYWTGDIKNVKEVIRSYGAIVLEDEYVEIIINDTPIIIAGIDDPEWTRYENKHPQKSMDELFLEFAAKSHYKILIAHRPEQIESYKQYPFDLVVSGHAHGGQARLPLLLNGLVAPNQGWLPEYVGGMYKHDSLVHIVSRGVSFNPRLPRIFNPPEIVVIDISQ